MSKKKIEKVAESEPMKVSERRFEEIDVIMIYRSPYQTRKTLTGIEELAASIKVHGMINPVTVRNGVDSSFEMIAGHRRWKAAELAGVKKIPAIVIDCRDQEAAELCVLENMQRNDLTPLEEAEGVKTLIDTGHTAQDVADRLGRSRKWVARRVALLGLCQEAKDALDDEDSPLRLAPIEGLEMIAAMPVNTQRTVIERFTKDWDPVTPTMANIREEIAEKMMELDATSFDKEVCRSCPMRTGAQPDLFDDEIKGKELGRCLEPNCFNEKVESHIKGEIEAVKRANPGIILFSGDYMIRGKHEGVKPKWDVDICKQGDTGAVRAVCIAANGEIEQTWVKPIGNVSSEAPKGAQPTKEQKAMAEFVKQVVAKIEATLDEKRKAGAGHPFESIYTSEVLSYVLLLGTNNSNGVANAAEWNSYGGVDSCRSGLWEAVQPVVLRRLRYFTVSKCLDEYREAMKVNEFLLPESGLVPPFSEDELEDSDGTEPDNQDNGEENNEDED